MICRADGALIGAVSGGCVEADVYERSREVIAQGRATRVLYDARVLGDDLFGLGLGCDGELEILIEPFSWWRSEVGRALFAETIRLLEAAEPVVLAVCVPAQGEREAPCARLLVDRSGIRAGGLGSAPLDDAARAAAEQLLAERSASRMLESGSGEGNIFLDLIEPSPRLIVVGSGHDAIPLVRMARELDVSVTVFDNRELLTSQERFPWAREVACAPIEALVESVSFDGSPAVVIMTHSYAKDGLALRLLFGADPSLSDLGLLGPRPRSERLLDELAREGVRPSASIREVLRYPVGLDLGSESPAEIALSVLAEILAQRNRRAASPLSQVVGPIHAGEAA